MENGEHSSASLTNGHPKKSDDNEEGDVDSSFSSPTAADGIFNRDRNSTEITVAESSRGHSNQNDSSTRSEPVVVDNLIDLDDDDADNVTPSYLSPTTSVKMFNK